MTALQAQEYMQTEVELVTRRLALQYLPEINPGEGNPMTVEEAAKALDGVVRHVRNRTEPL